MTTYASAIESDEAAKLRRARQYNSYHAERAREVFDHGGWWTVLAWVAACHSLLVQDSVPRGLL